LFSVSRIIIIILALCISFKNNYSVFTSYQWRIGCGIFSCRSYSWSANICGCKKWLLYPPGQEKYLTDRLGNLAYDILSDDMYDGKKFPDFDKARKPITVIQREGEVIFVPRYYQT